MWCKAGHLCLPSLHPYHGCTCASRITCGSAHPGSFAPLHGSVASGTPAAPQTGRLMTSTRCSQAFHLHRARPRQQLVVVAAGVGRGTAPGLQAGRELGGLGAGRQRAARAGCAGAEGPGHQSHVAHPHRLPRRIPVPAAPAAQCATRQGATRPLHAARRLTRTGCPGASMPSSSQNSWVHLHISRCSSVPEATT